MLCGHRQDAEDAVQEAYVEALRSWNRLSEYEAPEAWVRKVMRQRLWKIVRHKAKLTTSEHLDVDTASSQASPEETAEARAVLAALGALPDNLRYVMVMHCLYGVPQQELADELGITRNAIALRVRAARQVLEASLGMVPTGRHSADSLLPAAGRLSMHQIADPLVRRLRETESWLQRSAADNAEAVDLALAAVVARAEKPTSWRRITTSWRTRRADDDFLAENDSEVDGES